MDFILSISRLASWKMLNNNVNQPETINNDGHEEDTCNDQDAPTRLEESTGVEEYAALSTFLTSENDAQRMVAPCRSGSTLHQRRYDLYERLIKTGTDCYRRYGGRNELATETDEDVTDLCKILEEVFQYGLIQQDVKFVASAAKLFQNMHQIVSSAAAVAANAASSTGISGLATGISERLTTVSFSDNDSCFWDFCQKHLNASDRDRFENLQNVHTKLGRGKAFIRAALNEQSLQHYLNVWLSKPEILNLHYSHWSLLVDTWISANLLELFKCLGHILFALDMDKAEFDVYTKYTLDNKPKFKEPIIFAPQPSEIDSKTTMQVIERPITAIVNKEKQLNTSAADICNKDGRENEGQPVHVNKASVISVEEFRNAVERILPTNTTCDNSDIGIPHSIDDYLENCYGFSQRLIGKNKDTSENGEKCGSISSLDEGSSKTSSLNQLSVEKVTETAEEASPTGESTSANPLCRDIQHAKLHRDLIETHEKCNLLETRVAQLDLENRQLIRRLKQYFGESGIDPSSSFATNFLITIPRCKMDGGTEKSGTRGHYVYEIHITMRQNLEHWSLWRRYSDFYKLHQGLLRTHPTISSVTFPPKKRFGNLQPQFVDERRQQLQIYLQNLVEMLPQLEACKTKSELQKVFPFLKPR